MKSSIRGLSSFVTGAAFVALALLVPNCQPTGGEQVGATGGNGGSGEGGSGGNGSGGNGSGGNGSGGNGSGGSTTRDGSGGSNSGGTTSKGGAGGSNSGGTTSKGGSSGTPGSGGSTTTPGSGGTTTTPGNGGTTTTPGSGGTTTPGSGGTTTSSTKNTGSTVTFDKGKAAGAMTGYGWVALGSLDTITDPTCGASKTPITSITPCASDPNWSGTGLCITGSCPALGATPDYTNNYGVVVGVNAGDAGGTGDASLVLGQTFTSITITATGAPTSEVRAQIHIKGDADSKSYCLKFTSGTAMDFAKFATDCYATAPTGLFPAASAPNIDKVSLEAVSATTAVSVTSMCMTGITFK
jgi:hypothetical protein